ncbi:class I SAM-dependent methyltransferase [Geomonas oryzisoli]|uniref:Class I SAM-dependent methyltransferase n=1 Tax=Geomonas oryzisoli TaxID=2847992 RepID=A0ABX8JDA6_9BACT|nr:class I SAM-dependent methyltransferase [Geomonas oryzisoli]QWV95071.1 class I SAM-dependent methyltransferase [Geomonas oryzisoli]
MSETPYALLMSTANRLTMSHLREFWRSLLVPMDYTRTREIPALLAQSGILERKGEPLKILDIGSPQILSLTLCLRCDDWEVTYLNPFEPELEDMRRKASALGVSSLNILKGDITRQEALADLGTFDYVFSCSVFEHIHPEHGGDVIASRNIAPLLKRGGSFVFSVPYAREGFHEYIEGDAYAVKGDASKKTFFQRFYDERSLREQILAPSGLTTAGQRYIGERRYHGDDIRKRMAFLIGFGWRALVLGRFFRAISGFFMEESPEYTTLAKPYLAVCALVKE